jgi:hypothetical protein
MIRKKADSFGKAIPLAKFAERLFEKEFHGNDAQSRVEDALQLVLAKFNAGLVVVRSGCTPQRFIFIAQKKFGSESAPREVVDENLFCHSLTKNRVELDLDYAGSGPWQNHPARTLMGWESYYGLRKNMDDDRFLSLGIYHSSPRIQRITAADKIFMQNLLAWIETTLWRSADFRSIDVATGNSATVGEEDREIPLKN